MLPARQEGQTASLSSRGFAPNSGEFARRVMDREHRAVSFPADVI